MKLSALLIFAAALANGQIDRTLHFLTAPPPAALEEAATLLRTVGGIGQLRLDPLNTAIDIRGSASEILLAEWLVNQLDRPGGPPTREYRLPGNQDDVIRVFLSPRLQATQDREAVLAATRAKLRITRSSTSTGAAAVVLRDTAARIERAAQLIESRQ